MPVTSDGLIDLVGAWKTYESRKLDLVARVESVKITSVNTRVISTAHYAIGKEPVEEGSDALAVWIFRKQSIEDKTYKVVLHKDGAISCDCPAYNYRKVENPVLCPHQSTVLTIADAFKELLVPLPGADTTP